MPATEQTSRNIKTLHVVFGVSSLLLLLTTIWMLAADHNREAKELQKQFGLIETRFLQWRAAEQLTTDFVERRETLKSDLTEARRQKPDDAQVAAFIAEANARPNNGYDLGPVEKARADLAAASEPPAIEAARDRLVAAMQAVLNKATFVENESQRKLKFTKADLDVDMSMLAIGIDENQPQANLDQTQEKITGVRGDVEGKLTEAYQANKAHRIALADQLAAITRSETDAKAALDKHNAEIARLETAIQEKAPNAGKWFLELPVLDAFGGPLKPQQIWLPDLPWNNNFRNVARFDRCITCHQGIDKTAPGSSVDPAYEAAHDFVVMLETPQAAPPVESLDKSLNDRLKDLYGMTLAETGLVTSPNAVTVEAVFPRLDGPPSPRDAAVRAGLRSGDVIVRVGDASIDDKDTAQNYLADGPVWGTPLQLTIRRGVPQPFAGHPRLDLFVGSMSPHKAGDFGCTICHEGQGNATAFKWASHTPNDTDEMTVWTRDHGWFNNHHWIYPMLPERFEEANCLKCHHEVTELKPSERFPDPPAPKLVAGYETIENVGCFGCHEINGYDGPKKRVGPDMRAEPNYFAAAEQALADRYFAASASAASPEEIGYRNRLVESLRKVIDNPLESAGARRLAAELIASDAELKSGRRLSDATHAMGAILKIDDETPGRYPKVGPSLRNVAYKNSADFLYSWIKSPTNFRPTTKMPTFFGLRDHLREWEDGHIVNGPDGAPKQTPGAADADRFEPIEIRAITEYLLNPEGKSAAEMAGYSPYQYAEQPSQWQGKTVEPPDVARGKFQFQTRGCLACHSFTPDNEAEVKDFAGIRQTQGPDLSGLGAKLRTLVIDDPGKKYRVNPWLYTWLKDPTTYHARTVMPNLLLEPTTSNETRKLFATQQPVPALTTDPAADIAAYLMSNTKVNGQDWRPEAMPTTVKASDLDELLQLYLVGAFPKVEAREYAAGGIPAGRAGGVKGDEKLLVVGANSSADSLQDAKLRYLGKKTIGRLGCAGCHDIPGFEDSKPIGTGLNNWGRKEPSKLAFEQIMAYLEHKEGHGHADDHYGPEKADHEFYMYGLHHHQREGFIWQKLREPRSYDYKKTENKSYIDRLRMPQFRLTNEQREAIITFVLGLVTEPPPARYIYQPSPRQAAIQAGQRVIDKYNCAGCHKLQMQELEIQYQPGTPQPQPLAGEYEFLIPHYSPAQIEASKKPDRRGLGRVTLRGLAMPKTPPEEGEPAEPIQPFQLWSASLIDGKTFLPPGSFDIDERINPGLADFMARGGAVHGSPSAMHGVEQGESEIIARNYHPQIGGALADYLYPIGLAQEKAFEPNVKLNEPWGYVPPPLTGEGRKVDPRWLHDFLLDPVMIRPAAMLRMPKFHMTGAEASAIVNHFAAKDGAEFPYEYDQRSRGDYLSERNREYVERSGRSGAGNEKRLDDAMLLVTDKQLCSQCHKIGGYVPARAASQQAPDLANVGARLRPEYLRDWIANPARILPYTGMPVNFAKTERKAQDIFPGTSEEQINGIVDLLLSFDRVMSGKIKIEQTGVDPVPAGGAQTGAATTTPNAPSTTATPAATTPSTTPPTTGSPAPMPVAVPSPTSPRPSASPSVPPAASSTVPSPLPSGSPPVIRTTASPTASPPAATASPTRPAPTATPRVNP